jgi:RNA polymerase sigma factor (sigma-70 family)
MSRMRDYLMITDLVARAGKGERQAWDALVERYSPLVWSICRRHRLDDADARAVGQSIWRQLVHHLDRVQDPGALACWLAAAAWRECGNARSAKEGPQIAGEIANGGRQPSHQPRTAEQARLIAERHATLREAFSRLPPGCQRLLTLLIDEPPVPDTEISARLGIPVGGIGPARSRCLDKLRRDPAIAALTSGGTARRECLAGRHIDDHQHSASSGPAGDVAPVGEGTQ